MASLWDDATDPYAGQPQQPDPNSMWGWLHSMLGNAGQVQQAEAAASTAIEPTPVGQYFNDVVHGVYAKQGYDRYLSPEADPIDVAMAFTGGGMATKARPAAASDLPAPNLSKGADAPLFDYSLPPPDVPQTPLLRAPPPPKGIPDYVQAISSPENVARVREQTEAGLGRLGDRYWYNPSPLLDAFGNALGSGEQATRNLKLYTDMMGNTTNLARVPQNQRMASWYYQKYLDDPETMPTEPPPKGSGYGHAAQQQHLTNVQNWWPTQTIDPVGNPKPASFSENLTGNMNPYTWDTRNGTIWNLRNTKGDIITAPEKQHYGYLENTGQKLANDMGITPARQQEASWVNMEPPGPVQTFAEGMEQKIRDTAAKFNMDPRDVLKFFAQGKQLLWGLPAGLLASQAVPSDQSTR